jgi:hypothetical protein
MQCGGWVADPASYVTVRVATEVTLRALRAAQASGPGTGGSAAD